MMLLAYFLAGPSAFSAAGAGEVMRGPVEAIIERVIDGDTVVAVAHVWPGHSVRVSIRIRGIDAPEMRSRCAAERSAGQAARQALARLLESERVLVRNIGADKYYGRVVADLVLPDGRHVAETLLADRHVRPYGGGERVAYC